MSGHAQRPRPEQIEKLVTKLAEDVHNAVGGKPFPAKLIQTAVSVLSSEKAVSTEKWERVMAVFCNAALCFTVAVHICKISIAWIVTLQDVQTAKINLSQSAAKGAQFEQQLQHLDAKG